MLLILIDLPHINNAKKKLSFLFLLLILREILYFFHYFFCGKYKFPFILKSLIIFFYEKANLDLTFLIFTHKYNHNYLSTSIIEINCKYVYFKMKVGGGRG